MLESFLFICQVILGVLDGLCALANVYSWIKGKPNRVERKEARKNGEEPPPRDAWNERVIGLTIIVCIITGVIVTVYLGRR